MMNLPIPVLRRFRSLSFRLIGATALAAMGTITVLAPALSAAPVPVIPSIPYELPPSSPPPQNDSPPTQGANDGPAPAPRATPTPRPSPTAAPIPIPAPTRTVSPATTVAPTAVPPITSESAERSAEVAAETAQPPANEDAAPPQASAGFTETLTQPAPAPGPASSALGDPVLPRGWVLIAGFAAVAAALLTGLLIVRRRRRAARPLALAAPAAASATPASGAEPARVDVQIDIVGATRSVMMFGLEYRLELTNRADRGLGDVRIAAHLTCARRGANNSAPAGAAQHLHDIARIGPQQSRAVDGIVRLPLADITILRQGAVPLFVPLLHVTIAGTGFAPITRSYAIGTPSAANFTRLHPVLLGGQPGRIEGLRAQIVTIPGSEDGAG